MSSALLVGQEDFRDALAAAVEDPCMAYALHQCTRGSSGEHVQCCVAGFALADTGTDLDQFMVREGPIQLVDHTVRESGVAEHDDGAQGMRQTTQMFLLLDRKSVG